MGFKKKNREDFVLYESLFWEISEAKLHTSWTEEEIWILFAVFLNLKFYCPVWEIFQKHFYLKPSAILQTILKVNFIVQ